MEVKQVVVALQALAQESRLELFRLLVRRGTAGIPAGQIAKRLGVPPTTLSFHLAQLSQAGLIAGRREGRRIHYAADYGRMQSLLDFLMDNCCAEGECGAQRSSPVRTRSERKGRT